MRRNTDREEKTRYILKHSCPIIDGHVELRPGSFEKEFFHHFISFRNVKIASRTSQVVNDLTFVPTEYIKPCSEGTNPRGGLYSSGPRTIVAQYLRRCELMGINGKAKNIAWPTVTLSRRVREQLLAVHICGNEA